MSDTAEEVIDEQQDQNEEVEDQNEDNESSENGQEQSDELVVTIGDAPPASDEVDPEKAPGWIRELRQANRDKEKELRELKQKLAEKEAGAVQAHAEVPKPTLEGCEYDEEEYEKRFEAWTSQKRNKEQEQANRVASEKAAQEQWVAKLNAFEKEKSELKVSDYDDILEDVKSHFSEMQQGIIVNGADTPALTVYAIGKNHAEMKRLAAITDPVKFAFAIAKMETQVKTQNRKTPPAAEGKIRGTASTTNSLDNTLERLRAKAAETGDMSEVMKYKAKLRNKS